MSANGLPQEISEMLAGRMSNQDEDDVEDELEALEAEMSGTKLPDAPVKTPPTKLPEIPQDEPELQRETARERAQRRAREQATQAEPMLA